MKESGEGNIPWSICLEPETWLEWKNNGREDSRTLTLENWVLLGFSNAWKSIGTHSTLCVYIYTHILYIYIIYVFHRTIFCRFECLVSSSYRLINHHANLCLYFPFFLSNMPIYALIRPFFFFQKKKAIFCVLLIRLSCISCPCSLIHFPIWFVSL